MVGDEGAGDGGGGFEEGEVGGGEGGGGGRRGVGAEEEGGGGVGDVVGFFGGEGTGRW